MSAQPLVSIVIPVYNGGVWLQEAIDSALAQTWLNIEVLVVDDGSTDDGWTGRVAESYGDQIRLFRKPNGGVGSALNLGLTEMKGAFFSWLSHDDRYLPGKVEYQVRALLAQSAPAIAFGDAILIDENGKSLRKLGLIDGTWNADHPIWWVLEGRMSGCALMVPRICFETSGQFSETLPTTQDYDLWYRLAKRYVFIPTAGCFVESRTHCQQGSRLASHLAEAGSLWVRMLEDILASMVDWLAPSEVAFLERFQSLGAVRVYPGVAEMVEAMLSSHRRQTPVTVVVDTQRVDAEDACCALNNAGYYDLDLIFVHQPARADPTVVATAYRRMRRQGTLLTLSSGLGLHEIVGHILAAARTAILIFYDHSAEANLARRILTVAAGAEVAWPDGAIAAPSIFSGLNGSIMRPAALKPALGLTRRTDASGLVQALAMMDLGHWRETWRGRRANARAVDAPSGDVP